MSNLATLCNSVVENGDANTQDLLKQVSAHRKVCVVVENCTPYKLKFFASKFSRGVWGSMVDMPSIVPPGHSFIGITHNRPYQMTGTMGLIAFINREMGFGLYAAFSAAYIGSAKTDAFVNDLAIIETSLDELLEHSMQHKQAEGGVTEPYCIQPHTTTTCNDESSSSSCPPAENTKCEQREDGNDTVLVNSVNGRHTAATTTTENSTSAATSSTSTNGVSGEKWLWITHGTDESGLVQTFTVHCGTHPHAPVLVAQPSDETYNPHAPLMSTSTATRTGPCLYSVLGLEKGATDAEIRKAYKRCVLKFHPDRNTEEDAAEKFKEVAVAYEVLADANKRAAYDSGQSVDDLLTDDNVEAIVSSFIKELFGAGDIFTEHFGELMLQHYGCSMLQQDAWEDYDSEEVKAKIKQREHLRREHLQHKLRSRLDKWIANTETSTTEEIDWANKAVQDSSGGAELIDLIGWVYTQVASEQKGGLTGVVKHVRDAAYSTTTAFGVFGALASFLATATAAGKQEENSTEQVESQWNVCRSGMKMVWKMGMKEIEGTVRTACSDVLTDPTLPAEYQKQLCDALKAVGKTYRGVAQAHGISQRTWSVVFQKPQPCPDVKEQEEEDEWVALEPN
eukprot:TRINITY_DN5440_c0_g1_i1.p1 TRINITY_DN5440_c0_g1~~TRINITY_DN5440_c0_g1_i1.p1  ORF type:complete len:622 (+),score=57.23 TRINITY_DN5440_c0_g1_i1:43-1908(+)